MNKPVLLDTLGKSAPKNVTPLVKAVTMSMDCVNTVVIQAGRECTVKHLVTTEHMEIIAAKHVENVVMQNNATTSTEHVIMDVKVGTKVTSVMRVVITTDMEKTVERHVEIAWTQYNVIISTEPV